MKEFWNERYAAEESAYGQAPNAFFKEQLDKLPPGKLLLPAEGEGRNGIYAARQGWEVHAFDLSEAGKAKAEKRARSEGVSINYQVGEFSTIRYPAAAFDAIALIFAHFPADRKLAYHRQLDQYLKTGGTIILEAFSKAHLPLRLANEKAGGPRDIDMLYSTDELRQYFPNYEIMELGQKEVFLEEGLYHRGISSVVRFVGKKSRTAKPAS